MHIGRRIQVEQQLPAPDGVADETWSLAGELSHAYHQMVTLYQEQMGLTGADADARARGADMTPEEAADDLARIRERPPEQVTWSDLLRLAERDPEAMLEVWENQKAAARDELASGHRAAQALDWQRRPWARARYLAIRDSFRAGTPPASGVEAALVDLAAEAYSDYLELSEQVHRMLSSEAEIQRDDLEREGRWHPPHVTVADAIERTGRQAERAHQRFLRTVKTLNEVQRLAPTLYVAHAGQINVGQQQVNVAGSPSPLNGVPQDLPK
jgi:hypothetical protein